MRAKSHVIPKDDGGGGGGGICEDVGTRYRQRKRRGGDGRVRSQVDGETGFSVGHGPVSGRNSERKKGAETVLRMRADKGKKTKHELDYVMLEGGWPAGGCKEWNGNRRAAIVVATVIAVVSVDGYFRQYYRVCRKELGIPAVGTQDRVGCKE